MRFSCTHCGRAYKGDDTLVGRTVNCPTCSKPFVVTPIPTASITEDIGAPIDQRTLRDDDEGTAFGWVIFFSVFGWLFLACLIAYVLPIIVLIIAIRYLVQLFAAAYIKTNAVEVSERQFPKVWEIVTSFSQRLGKTPPTVYVMQQNVWNAVAMKAGQKAVCCPLFRSH